MNIKTIRQLYKSYKGNKKVYSNPHHDVNIYIPQLNVIYIGISKTGISSMKSLFLNKLGESYNEENYNSIHVKGHEVFEYIPIKEIVTKQDFKFSFVRNPFDRLVSCYKNKILQEDYPPILNAYGSLFYKGMPFADFVKTVCQVPDFLSDRHFRSQYSYLYYKDTLIIDFLGKFENIEKDFEVIRKKYDLNELPHINQSKGKIDYRDYYTPELVELVSKRYKNDIEKFDYISEFNDLTNFVKNKQ